VIMIVLFFGSEWRERDFKEDGQKLWKSIKKFNAKWKKSKYINTSKHHRYRYV